MISTRSGGRGSASEDRSPPQERHWRRGSGGDPTPPLRMSGQNAPFPTERKQQVSDHVTA